jgi:pilus assembly protein CpaE
MASESIKVLVIDDLPETREMLRKLLSFETDIQVVGEAATGREGLKLADELQPEIVLMDINMPDMDGIEATEEIKKTSPAIGVIIMSVQSDASYLRRAMMAGARDYITKPVSAEMLYEAIRRVYDSLAEERSKISSPMSSSDGTSGKKLKTDASGHVIAVFSPQGGAGVTTIATNVAVSLMQEGTRVVLIDGDLQWGDVGVFLNLTSRYTIGDLAGAITELDQKLLEGVIVSHGSGLKVLLAPSRLEDAERIAPSDLATIIQQMTLYYDYIIVDMPKGLNDNALSIMDRADRIILVATPTLPSIKSTRMALELFGTLDYTAEKVIFVMNRVIGDGHGRASIPMDAIESNLHHKTDAQIPLDEISFLAAVNQGVSIVAIEPDKSPALDLIRLADKVRHSLSGDEAEFISPVIPERHSRLSGIWAGLNN